MTIAQLVVLSHRPAPPGMVAEPRYATTIDPTWDEIRNAIVALNKIRFMLILSSRMDIDAPSDPDALTVEYGSGHGYMLYQQGYTTELASTSWRSKSTESIAQPSTIKREMVLRIVAAYRNGDSFDQIAAKFPEV